jgi:amidase
VTTFITTLSIGSGLKVAIKDLIDLRGEVTTAGCRGLADLAEPAADDASCLAEIRRRAERGAVEIVGKTNLHELAYGTTGVNDWYGTPRNPLDPALIPGGSSSGSAVAVATGAADVALGSDTGGSVRVPAACCGVAGLKTTWGRIPLGGVWPLAPSLDTVGPLARDVAGLVSGMALLEGGFAAVDVPDGLVVKRLRLGADPRIDAAIDNALAAAELVVAETADPGWDGAWAAAGGLLSAEAWRADRDLVEHRRDGISAKILSRLEAGASITAEQEQMCRDAQHTWRETLGAIVGPASILALPTLGEFPPALEVERFPGSRLTLSVNLAGLPALSIPVPSGSHLPASLQLVGPAYGEELLLAVGARVESAVQ